MESLIQTSELLTHQVAAVAIPNSRHFVAARDEYGRFMLFSIGTDSKLHVSKIGVSGQREVLDLGLMLDLPADYKAHAMDVVQDPLSSTLYIAVATASSGNQNGSILHILRPVKPCEVDFASSSNDLGSYIMPETGSHLNPRIYSIFMSKSTVGAVYPPLLFAYKMENFASQDLNRADVSHTSYHKWTWTRKSDIVLPKNAALIRSIEPVNFQLGNKALPGFVTLYQKQGQMKLLFRTMGVFHEFQRKLHSCPQGACVLGSLVNAHGFTDLLVGGRGLFRYKGTEIKDPWPVLVSDEGVFASVKTLQVTQSEIGLSIWAENSAKGIGYVKADPGLISTRTPVQVVPDGQGGFFRPLKATKTDAEKFITSSKEGKISLLEQDSISGLWTAIPLMTPALDAIIKMPSYMTHITALGKTGVPMIKSKVRLRSSGDTSIIVNGRPILATPAGVEVETDQSGHLTLFSPTADIAAHVMTFSAFEKGDKARTFEIDPSSVVHKRLQDALDKHSLADMPLPDGTKLMDGIHIKPEEIKTAGDVIKDALQHRRKLIQGSSHDLAMGPERGVVIQDPQPAEGLLDMAWDAWYWLESQGKKVVKYLIKGAEFFVFIAGKTYRWTIMHVAKVISWIFDKILDVASKLIPWLGFVFDWRDITATKGSIVNMANDGLDWAKNNASTMRTKADGFFDQLETILGHKRRPSSADVDNVNGNADDLSASKGVSENIASRSAAVNWTRYQIEHGGVRDGAIIYHSKDLDGVWDQHLQKFHGTLLPKVTPVQTKLVQSWDHGKRSISVKSAFEQIVADFLLETLRGIRGLTDGCLTGIQKLLQKLKAFLSAKLHIPIFSTIYKDWTGNDLTVLDGMAWVIAIPATVIAKLARSDKFFNAVKKGDFSAVLEKVRDGSASAQATHSFNEFANIAGIAAMGISVLFDVFSVSSFDSSAPVAPSSPSAPLAAAAVKAALDSGGSAVSAGGEGGFNWGVLLDTALLVYHLMSVPSDTKLPAYTLRLSSWLVSMLSSLVTFVLHLSAKFIGTLKEKIRAVLDAIVEMITYSLEIAIRVKEIQTSDWGEKDDSWSKVDCVGHTFLLIGISGGSLKNLDPEPFLKALGRIAQIIGSTGGTSILGAHGITLYAKEKFCDPPRYGGST